MSREFSIDHPYEHLRCYPKRSTDRKGRVIGDTPPPPMPPNSKRLWLILAILWLSMPLVLEETAGATPYFVRIKWDSYR